LRHLGWTLRLAERTSCNCSSVSASGRRAISVRPAGIASAACGQNTTNVWLRRVTRRAVGSGSSLPQSLSAFSTRHGPVVERVPDRHRFPRLDDVEQDLAPRLDLGLGVAILPHAFLRAG
jgi:hypothetical protein